MNQKYPYRKIFIEEFVKSLVLQFPHPEKPKELPKEDEHQPLKAAPVRTPTKMQTPAPPSPLIRIPPKNQLTNQKTAVREISPQTLTPRPPPRPQKGFFPIMRRKPPVKTQLPTSRINQGPPMQIPAQQTPSKVPVSILGKIAPLLKDPSVQSIECKGPGKNILVNKSGSIQATPITLSKEEINEIMEKISKETKIPLITGVFKAILGNMIITAVISEHVGTRFVINKRAPNIPA